MENHSFKYQHLLIFLLFLFGISIPFYYWIKPEPLTPEDKILIQRAVLNSLIGDSSRSPQRNISFYINIEGSDPSQELMEIFEDHDLSVAPKSQIPTCKEFDNVIDKYRKRVEISISKISQQLDGKVEVEVDFYSGPMNAGGYEYLLEYKEGGWQIIHARLVWIA